MFAQILEIVVSIGIAIYGMRRFLVLRKYWQYRHEYVATQGISVIARLLSLGASVPFLIKFVFVDKNLILSAKELIDVTITGSIMLIGTGLWVEMNRGINPFKLAVKVVKQERREALRIQTSNAIPEADASLASLLAAVRPAFASHFAEAQLTAIDRLRAQLPEPAPANPNAAILATLIQDYLQYKPRTYQVKQLHDALLFLFGLQTPLKLDQPLIPYEQIEILRIYINKVGRAEQYKVVIVPQNPAQTTQIVNEYAACQEQCNGGAAYTIPGAFYTEGAAQTASAHFSTQNLFSIVEFQKNR